VQWRLKQLTKTSINYNFATGYINEKISKTGQYLMLSW